MSETDLLKRAAQCRDLAATAVTDEARVILLELADGYERIEITPRRPVREQVPN